MTTPEAADDERATEEQMPRFDNKIVVITGAGRGQGRNHARGDPCIRHPVAGPPGSPATPARMAINYREVSCAVSYSTQVAFQLDNASLAAVDGLAARERRSRAELLRTAVREFLAERREREIDAQLATGYGQHPPGAVGDAGSPQRRGTRGRRP